MSLSSLRDLLNQHFCDDELRRLCFHLSIEPENLLGHTCVARAQALVEHCLHHGRLPTLGARCRELYPAVAWPDVETLAAEWEKIQEATTAQEKLQGVLPDDQLATMLVPLRQRETDILTQLLSSGALAQGAGAVAVGAGGTYVSGSVGGDVVLGDKITTHDPTQTYPAALRHAYLQRLLATSNQLSLAGVDPKTAGSEPEQLELAAVYTALSTESWGDEERRDARQPAATNHCGQVWRLTVGGIWLQL